MKNRLLQSGVRLGLGASALALSLVGCAWLNEPYKQPAMPVADAWLSDTAAMVEHGQDAASLYWRDYFAEPQLVSLIETALANNRDLRVALLRVEEARALYGIQRADQFPAIGAGAQGSRTRVPGDLNVSGQPLVANSYEAYVGLSTWEIDLWGRVRSLNDAALQEYLATDAAGRAVRLALIAEVANAYINLRHFDERIALAHETLENRQESFRIFGRRAEVGSISRLELTQVETLLLQAQSLEVQLRQARSVQAHALSVLLGGSGDTVNAVPNALDSGLTFAELRVGLPSELLVLRPDIIAAEHRLRAAHANILAARAAFFPRIALTGSLGTASTKLDGLFHPDSGAWALMPTVSIPIFDAGRRGAALSLAEVRNDISVAHYEKTIQNAFREVADALSSRQELVLQVEVQRKALSVQTERARLAQLSYDNGATAYLEVLDAQRDLLMTQQQLVQAERDLLLSQVALYAALGGGASDPDVLSTNN